MLIRQKGKITIKIKICSQKENSNKFYIFENQNDPSFSEKNLLNLFIQITYKRLCAQQRNLTSLFTYFYGIISEI